MPGYCTIRGDVLDYDRRVEALSSDAYRLFMLTLYSRGRTMLGLMRFVPADAVPRVRAWDEATASAALAELQQARLVEYDPEARLLYQPMALEFAPVKGLNQVRGAMAILRELPDSSVLLPALAHVLTAAQAEARGKAKDGQRDLVEIIEELQTRRAIICQPPAQPLGTPYQPPAEGVDTPLIPHAEGVGRGYQGGLGPESTSSGQGDQATTCGVCGYPMPRGSEGGPEGVGRGSCACARPGARARAPDPDPEPEPPPKPPPPAPVRGPAAPGEGGKETGAGKYELLDPRSRPGAQSGASAGEAGTRELPGLRPTG